MMICQQYFFFHAGGIDAIDRNNEQEMEVLPSYPSYRSRGQEYGKILHNEARLTSFFTPGMTSRGGLKRR